jgi:hypothetical protein
MPEQHLNRAEVCAGIEHMSGAGVAKQVWMNATSDARSLAGFKAQGANRAVVQK